jgi:hypothetical protein
MGGALKFSLCLIGSYAFIVVLILAFSTVSIKPCDDDSGDLEFSGCHEFGSTFRYLLATFHGTTWGDIIPVSDGEKAIACLVATMGYLWPLGMALLVVYFAGQSSLARLGSVALVVAYGALAVAGNLALAGALVVVAGGAEYSPGESFGKGIYFAWMTFHSRSYGDLAPASVAEDTVTCFIVFAGTFGWLAPLLLVARTAALNTARHLQDPVAGKTLLMPALMATFSPYFANFVILLILAGIYTASDPSICTLDCEEGLCPDMSDTSQKCGFGPGLFILLTTFHGNAFGHYLPSTHGQVAMACIAAALGFLWRHGIVILLLRAAGQPMLAKQSAIVFGVTYLSLAVLGNFVLAAAVVGVCSGGPICSGSHNLQRLWSSGHVEDMDLALVPAEGCNFGVVFYYMWMTFHGRAYGEIVPVTTAEEVLSLCSVVSGACCWTIPVLIMVRRTSLVGVLQEVTSGAPPTVLGVVQGQ